MAQNKTRVKCTFGTQRDFTVPVYDDREAHIHIWKPLRLIQGLTHEQNPLRKTIESRIPVNPRRRYCSICHCAEPHVFKMRDISLRPPDETWIDEYNDSLRKRAPVACTVSDIRFERLSLKSVVNDMDILFEKCTEDCFKGYVQAVSDEDFLTALSLIVKCCALLPKNLHYKKNLDSAIIWLQAEQPRVLEEHFTIRDMWQQCWKFPTRPVKNMPHRFSLAEKQIRADLRSEIMKPVDITNDKTKRRKLTLSKEQLEGRRKLLEQKGFVVPPETTSQKSKRCHAICHPLLRRPNAVYANYIVNKKYIQ